MSYSAPDRIGPHQPGCNYNKNHILFYSLKLETTLTGPLYDIYDCYYNLDGFI